jgi:hypothetical protein
MTNRHLVVAAAACPALAAVSLFFATEPVYDAWAWLVWGRELAHLDLDTSSGPSWKPLTVLLTTLLAPAGDAAPTLWLGLVRTAWLFAVVLAAHLAYRLSAPLERRARVAAGAAAALTLVLLADGFTAWTRQGAAGMSEPLLVALVLGAIAAHLDGRPRLALAVAGCAALLRPETWPLLAVYALSRWRADPGSRPWLAALAIALGALWIAPDLLTGDGASAGERALRGGGEPLHELFEVFARAAPMPLAAAWPLAVLAVAGRPRDRTIATLGGGALGWICVVAVMAFAGFPGLPRFMAPAVAVAGVLAGVGLARLLSSARRPLAAAALAAVLLVTAAQIPGRAGDVSRALDDTAEQARSNDRLRALTRSIARDRLLGCGALATSDVLVRPALAWDLDVPLRRVVSYGRPPRASGAFIVGLRASIRVRRHTWPGAELLGASGDWRVYSIDCPAAAGSASSAGVSGARR